MVLALQVHQPVELLQMQIFIYHSLAFRSASRGKHACARERERVRWCVWERVIGISICMFEGARACV